MVLRDAEKSLNRAQIKPLPASLLPSVEVTVNGVKIPALLDTGSPITVPGSQGEKWGPGKIEKSCLGATRRSRDLPLELET